MIAQNEMGCSERWRNFIEQSVLRQSPHAELCAAQLAQTSKTRKKFVKIDGSCMCLQQFDKLSMCEALPMTGNGSNVNTLKLACKNL